MDTRTKKQTHLRLISIGGIRVDESSKRSRSVSSPSRRPRVHGKKLLRAQVLTLSLKGSGHLTPPVRGDAPSNLPLLGSPMTDSHIGSHIGDGVPAGKNVVYGFHNPDCAGDELSRQQGTSASVTQKRSRRTICPMGRGTTPARFKDEFADRLRSARIAAGYSTQGEFAQALGVPTERYKKWESGRTPIPHQYVPLACDLLEKDANYLFRVAPKAARKYG